MKVMLACIYIRTLLAIVEKDITPTMAKIMQKCTDLERRLYRKDKEMYLECTNIAKTVWPRVKDDKTDYTIHVEPVVCSIYYSVETEMKKLKFKPTLFNRLYDKYFHTSNCELENKSVKLSDEIWKITDEVMKERIFG